MVKPQFTRRRFDQNIADSERHMQLVFTAFGQPKENGWTDDVDLLVIKPDSYNCTEHRD